MIQNSEPDRMKRNKGILRRRTVACLGAVLLCAPCPAPGAGEADTILLFAGPEKHAPGTHEIAAGARLLQHCIDQAAGSPGVRTRISSEWRRDPDTLRQVRAVVFLGDQFPPTQLPGTEDMLTDLAGMVRRGCGIVCLHYATSVHREFASPAVQAALLDWVGGFGLFRAEPPESSSVARILEVTVTPVPADHAVLRGVGAFTVFDEPYFQLRFLPEVGPVGFQPLATAMLPPEAPEVHPVAWCRVGKDGHRGFGMVLPHFYVNWKEENLRRLILNGIFWAARCDIPKAGIETVLPSLETFAPKAVLFQKPGQKPAP